MMFSFFYIFAEKDETSPEKIRAGYDNTFNTHEDDYKP